MLVVVQGTADDRPGIFQDAVAIGASKVVFLPEGSAWLRGRLAGEAQTQVGGDGE